MTTETAPTTGRDRVAELDIIRGFALFGVLWMNLFEHIGNVIPEEHILTLPTVEVDWYVSLIGQWLAETKAQALFSFLFGLGFALFLDRAEKRGANGMTLYLRRITFLLVLGFAHSTLMFWGDILNLYAAMAFLLVLTRRWPSWLLLATGLALVLLNSPVFRLWNDFLADPAQIAATRQMLESGVAHRFEIYQSGDYLGFVADNFRSTYLEFYLTPFAIPFFAQVIGRFILGSWVYRKGWLQDPAAYEAGFRRWAPRLLVLGLLSALVGPLLGMLEVTVPSPWTYLTSINNRLAQFILPMGYAATIVVLCRTTRWRRWLSGLGSVGQMALTNYITHSFFYLFVLYGFGLNLLPILGATMALGLAIAVFAAQILFSRWWLARYRFGPLEWVWRSATYGSWQGIRLAPSQTPAAA